MEEDAKIINEQVDLDEVKDLNEELENDTQTTFNTDGLDVLVSEGEIENVEVCDKE